MLGIFDNIFDFYIRFNFLHYIVDIQQKINCQDSKMCCSDTCMHVHIYIIHTVFNSEWRHGLSFVWCVNVCSQKLYYFQGLKLLFVKKVGSVIKFYTQCVSACLLFCKSFMYSLILLSNRLKSFGLTFIIQWNFCKAGDSRQD